MFDVADGADGQDHFSFLDGGGELGRLVRDFAWERTALGPIRDWPQSLRTATSLLLRSPVPIVMLWGVDGFMIYNDAYSVFAGGRHPRLLGSKVREGWPEVADFNDHVMKVGLAGGTLAFKDQQLTLHRHGSPEPVWMNLDYSPVPDESGKPAGVLAIVIETTERIRAEAALRASEARFGAIVNSVEQMIWSTRPDGFHDYFNQRWYDFTGATPDAMNGESWNEMFHPDDQEHAWKVWRHSLATGEPYLIEYRLRHHSGEYRWVLGRAHAVHGPDGAIVRWYGTCTDIHDHRLAEDALRESRDHLAMETQALEIINATGAGLAAELTLDKLVQRVVDAGVELTGARFGAFFYNVLDEQGGRYMLYALAGADRGAFENFGMPRATAVFAPTFRGEGVIRSHDILADERYGHNPPHQGMPQGHLPVRSYLAVPVTSRSGEVIGGLFFGHEQPGVFTPRSERVMVGLAAQAAIGIDNARLFDAVQHANAELEERVKARTAELEQAHERLRQSQKMEAVGQLTGGIAHDFNNMLAVVMGSLELLKRRVGVSDARAQRYAEAAMDGARRAAVLTQRLLAFSRQQPLRPEPVDANKLVAGMSDLLRRALGADVQLETVLAGGLWRTSADPNQLENVILNLAVNARDAMPQGGRLTIETQNTHLDARYVASHLGVPSGQYVMIALTDTGVGMSEEVIAKAFDPFFTTKEVGKGTGLGLSQVYGFVKQTGGHVKIYSEIGHGTTVKVYLPRYLGTGEGAQDDPQGGDLPLGETQEVVLVVEDEPAVRQFSVDALGELGYRVLEADGAAAALRQLEAHPEISLMFTDVVMPEVNGARLAEEARRRWPALKVLFTTGYTRNAVVHNGVLDAGVQLIGKPFTLEELAAKVREVLDA
jgi:PAS domain S-box-containing protein